MTSEGQGADINSIRRLEPKLAQFLDHFHDCFGRKDTRAHLASISTVRTSLTEING